MGRTIRTLLLAVALAAGACSGDDDGTSAVTVPAADTTSSSTSSSSTQPTTTTEDPTVAVEQAFYDKWDAYVEAGREPDAFSPVIDQTFTGDAHTAFADALSRLLAGGNALRPPDDSERFQPRINELRILDQASAVVFECTYDGLVIYNSGTGDVVDDAVDHVAARNEFEFVDGRWKVARVADLEQGDPPCDF